MNPNMKASVTVPRDNDQTDLSQLFQLSVGDLADMSEPTLNLCEIFQSIEVIELCKIIR